MKPAKFKEQNIVYAEDQPEYVPLPAFRDNDPISNPKGEVVFCMQMDWKERLKVLFTGRVWVSLMMFRNDEDKINPLTPSYFTVNKKDILIESGN